MARLHKCGFVQTFPREPTAGLVTRPEVIVAKATHVGVLVPYLNCPTCGLTITETAARSPFQNCPRCLLRRGASAQMRIVREPSRFDRGAELERVSRARERLGGPLPGARSA